MLPWSSRNIIYCICSGIFHRFDLEAVIEVSAAHSCESECEHLHSCKSRVIGCRALTSHPATLGVRWDFFFLFPF